MRNVLIIDDGFKSRLLMRALMSIEDPGNGSDGSTPPTTPGDASVPDPKPSAANPRAVELHQKHGVDQLPSPETIEEPISEEEHAALQAEFDRPKGDPKFSYTVLRPFPFEGTIRSAGTVLELTKEQVREISSAEAVPPIWPTELVDHLDPSQLAAFKAGTPLHDPAASLEPPNSDLIDSVGKPKVKQVGEAHEPVTEADDPASLIGPRGKHAPGDVVDEPERKRVVGNASTVTDGVDSIGNVQLQHSVDEDGNKVVEPHHPHIGPRGPSAPKDTFKSYK